MEQIKIVSIDTFVPVTLPPNVTSAGLRNILSLPADQTFTPVTLDSAVDPTADTPLVFPTDVSIEPGIYEVRSYILGSDGNTYGPGAAQSISITPPVVPVVVQAPASISLTETTS